MPQTEGIQNTTLFIDSGSIKDNWQTLNLKSMPAATAAVVKSDAYGLGANKIIPLLITVGCNTFFVATIEEALNARYLTKQAEVYVLFGNNTLEEAEVCLENNITPVLNHLGQIEIWRKAVKINNEAQLETKKSKAWLHFDTGMTRLGIPKQELEKIRNNPTIVNNLNISGIMSHLACSDIVNHSTNYEQLTHFNHLRLWMNTQFDTYLNWSLANSSGIFLGKEYHFDITRPGASIYGINPQLDQKNIMKDVVRLQAKILQVQRVDTNQTVGYGGTYTVKKPGRIATIGLGYADGYFRAASGSAQVYIRDFRIPVVGRISMDLITLDITDVPEKDSHVGSIVDVIGPNYSVDKLAQDSGTIGYEILTSLGKRYKRIWL